MDNNNEVSIVIDTKDEIIKNDNNYNNNNDNDNEIINNNNNNLINKSSIFIQFKMLIYKRILYSKRDINGFVCNVFLPIILLLLGLSLLKFIPFGLDPDEYKFTLNDFNDNTVNDDIFPIIELDENEKLITEISNNEYYNNLTQLNIVNNFSYNKSIRFDNYYTKYGHLYDSGLVESNDICILGNCNDDLPEPIGSSILTLSNLLLENSDPNNDNRIKNENNNIIIDNNINNTNIYGAAIVQKQQIFGGRRCRIASLSTLSFNTVLCNNPDDECLQAELTNVVAAVLIPAAVVPDGIVIPDNLDVCIPIGCKEEVEKTFNLYNNVSIYEMFDEVFSTTLFTTLIPEVAPIPTNYYSCDVNECNSEPNIADLLEGKSTCRNNDDGSNYCVLTNYTPLLLNRTDQSSNFYIDDSTRLCEERRRRTSKKIYNHNEFISNNNNLLLKDNNNYRLLQDNNNYYDIYNFDENSNIPIKLQEPIIGPNCTNLPASNCTTTTGCDFLISFNQCVLNCNFYSENKIDCLNVIDGTNIGNENLYFDKQCSWNEQSKICAVPCSIATNENDCNSIEWSGSNCEWIELSNECKTAVRHKFTILANSTARHAIPIFTNILNNGILKNRLKYFNESYMDANIITRTHPLPYTKNFRVIITGIIAFNAAIFCVIAFVFPSASAAGYVVLERELVKHQQIVTGVNIYIYWISIYIYDFLIYLIPLLSAVILMYIFEIEAFTNGDAIYAVLSVLVLHGLAIFPLTYLLTLTYPNKHTTAINLTLMFGLIFGLVLMITSFVLSSLEITQEINKSLVFIFRLSPLYCLGDSLQQLAIQNILSAFLGEGIGGNAVNPFNLDVTGWNLIYLASEAVVFFSILLIIETRQFKKFFIKKNINNNIDNNNNNKKDEDEDDKDDDVINERKRVYKNFDNNNKDDDILLIKNVKKIYNNKKVAVNDITFGIRKGECFSLLGVNGAGKTSLLKILSGDIDATNGNVLINNLDIVKQSSEIKRTIGYCAQHNALLSNLTVYEHFYFFANIRGINNNIMDDVINKKMKELNLLNYRDVLTKNLSGGNQRKTAVGVATIGNPPLVFLDEPSSGVDASNKRALWNYINKLIDEQNMSFILTTHSMEESDALSNRAAIMVDGEFKAFGTIQHLKEKFGNGLMLQLKTKLIEDNIINKYNKEIIATLNTNDNNNNNNNGISVDVKIEKNDIDIENNNDNDNDNNINLKIKDDFIIAAKCLTKDEKIINDRINIIFMENGELNINNNNEIITGLNVDNFIDIDFFILWWLTLDNVNKITECFTEYFPKAFLVERHGNSLRYRLPNNDNNNPIKLSKVFNILETKKNDLNIQDSAVSSTSLEQIFNFINE